jgi:hypothetical protein
MLDPELADALVVMRQGESAGGLRMRETGRVEVQPDAEGLGPVDPVLEMFRLDLVPIHLLPAELTVERVQIEPMLAGDERQRLGCVRAQFIRRPGFAGIIAGGHDTAAQGAAEVLEPADIVALPAVK